MLEGISIVCDRPYRMRVSVKCQRIPEISSLDTWDSSVNLTRQYRTDSLMLTYNCEQPDSKPSKYNRCFKPALCGGYRSWIVSSLLLLMPSLVSQLTPLRTQAPKVVHESALRCCLGNALFNIHLTESKG